MSRSVAQDRRALDPVEARSSNPARPEQLMMPIQPGQRLAHYEIIAELGAGGMGTVYRASDTRLERDVAIKVLPADFSEDAERLQRFHREAKTLASLNHPNIGGIHGVHEEGGVHFLALELVQGQDLAERLGEGALPIDEAIDVCRQIAEGLEAAHEAGVVHRDLKPANIRITPDGMVKLLDFGLAKPIRPRSQPGGQAAAESDSFLLTSEGMVLGTPTYMSPEQARGRAVDRRTDIWAYGCVLYECLTGRRAFSGEAFGDLIAAILEGEADLDALPARTPAHVRDLIRRSLIKEPKSRLRDVGEARVVLEGGSGAPDHAAAQVARGRSPMATFPWAAAAAAGLGMLLGALVWGDPGAADPAGPATDEPRLRFTLMDTSDAGRHSSPRISPDGSCVAWSEGSVICVRPLDALETERYDVGHGMRQLMWSPDSEELAYYGAGSLWRFPRAGGEPLRIAELGERTQDGAVMLWTGDDQVLFVITENYESSNTYSIPVDGGKPVLLVESSSLLCWSAHELPGGQGFLGLQSDPRLSASARAATTSIVWMHDGKQEPLLELSGITAFALVEDALLLSRSIDRVVSRWRVPFDADRVMMTGEPELLEGQSYFASMARNGWTVASDADGEWSTQVCSVDLDGAFTPVGRSHSEWVLPPAKRSGDRFVYAVQRGGGQSLWIHDPVRNADILKTIHDLGPATVGTLPDGRTFVARRNPSRTYVYPESGSGEPELFLEGALLDISSDSRHALVRTMIGGQMVLATVDLQGDRTATPFGPADPSCFFAQFSPSGRWVIYQSKRTGTNQVYLRRFPVTEEEWQVSVDGGYAAVFTPEEDGLFYEVTRKDFTKPAPLMRVSFQAEPEVRMGAPELQFELPPRMRMAVSSFDGISFLATRVTPPSTSRIVIDTQVLDTAKSR